MQVNRLIRVAFGPFELGGLDDGAVEEVSTEALKAALGPEIAAQAQADFDAPLIEHEAPPAPPRHSGARLQGREPGIQKDAPSKHLDSGAPLRGSRNEKKKATAPRPHRRPAAEISEAEIMRVVGGRLRSRPIAGPKSDGLRPTADRLRESLFNILIHAYGDPVTGARVLDLFAGTGALGIEAISRGAAFALFVDDGVQARALLRDNVGTLGLGGVTRIFRRDATKLGPGASA